MSKQGRFTDCALLAGLAVTLGVAIIGLRAEEVGAADTVGPQGKTPAYLVLMHQAEEGQPKSSPRMNHFALPDPKLRTRLKDLGFEVGIAPYASGLTTEYLNQFNVVVIPHVYMPGTSPGLDEMVEQKKQLLLEYVKQGGGLLVMRVQGWQFGKDIDAANQWLAPCDIQILGEQVVDDEHKVKLESGYELSWTDNVTRHPATEGVKGIFYTTYHHMYSDSTSPIKAGKDWTILLRGKATTKSLRTVKGGQPPPPSPGTYGSEPPLLAVRDFGKGRIAVWPVNSTCIWQDGYHILWGRGLTMDGESSGMRGDAARLIANLMTYLAEPSRDTFGGYTVPRKPKSESQRPPGWKDWDRLKAKGAYPPRCFVGLIGAKSSLSSGQGTPEEFIQAAKEVGYDFIAFTEDLDQLAQEEFVRLQAICKQQSTETFKAYPGFAYLDESGNSWVTFSDRLRWPEDGWSSQKYPGRIKINNALSRGCQWPPVVLITSHSNPEKAAFQGNFKVISLYTYEDGKLVDDSVDTYLRLEKMRYGLSPVAVHLVTSPEKVKRARTSGYQTYVRWFDGNMVDALSGHIAKYKGNYVHCRSSFVSNGPIIEDTRILNFATSDLAFATQDRIRVHVKASSTAGLREVKILNSDSPRPWRRFLPGGEPEFESSIDHFHDKQYELIVHATDNDGKQAIGWGAWTAIQENSFPRCSDNINTMPRGKWWGPPEHLQNVRGIENYLAARDFRYIGLPTWGGLQEGIRPAVEFYPQLACRFGTIVDCFIDDHYPLTASGNPDRTDIPERAVPNESISGKVRHTLFTPWQDGPLVALVEGEFTAKEDFSLERPEVMRFNGRQGCDRLTATVKDGTLISGTLSETHRSFSGQLPVGGYAAMFPQAYRGSVGMIALEEGLKYHAFYGGSGWHNFRGVLADGNRSVKAGERLTYRYLGVVSRLDPPPDDRFVIHVRDSLGLCGKTAYRIDPRIGSVTGNAFILKLKAQGHGFAGTVTEANLPLNLPARIEGLNPRWHAGIWYPGRNTFEIAEWVVNDMNQRYTVRKTKTLDNEIRHFPVLEDGTGFLQIDTVMGDKDIFIGNLLTSDHADVCLTLVDTRADRAAFVVHNPTDNAITCEVRPGPGFTLLGEFRESVDVPPGTSVLTSCRRE